MLASESKFFLKGLRNIIEDESGIKVRVLTKSSDRGIERCFNEVKPKVLFFDDRTLKLDVQKLLGLIRKSPNTRLILFRDQNRGGVDFPNITYINKRTTSSQLIRIIKGERGRGSDKNYKRERRERKWLR